MATDIRDSLAKQLHGLPAGWRWEWFTDVLDVEGGTQPPASTFVDSEREGYVRLVQIRDFDTDAHRTYIPDSAKWSKCETRDVLIGRYGAALGRICRGLSGAYNVALAKVIPSSHVDVDFVYQLLRSPYFQQPLAAGGARSAQAGFNKGNLAVIPLPIPPLQEQAAIARILGTLDAKIELNRRMSASLEALARTFFRNWFVDFERRQMPSGWTTRPLASLCDYLSRGVGPAYCDTGGVLVLNQKCIRDHRVSAHHARRHNDRKRSTRGRLLRPLDILVNSTGTGTLGRVAQVLELSEPTIVDSHVTVVRPGSEVDPYYLGLELTGRETEIEQLAEGSTGQTELSRASLGAMTIVVPPLSLQAAFGHIAKPLFAQIAKNDRESRALACLRDTLLPKLLAGGVGELRTRGAP
ncbi:restriction endonuclease subunit S [Steroidobacter cummioxidans]|uniref:restriction endonuclease subunit S n=1 Tax=Steroidobacter cummioxidans TaxID=1803913 RepID=UPI000E31FC85|nr:restriction endonuclease subunit S [Steroidobacter cummioxidans]